MRPFVSLSSRVACMAGASLTLALASASGQPWPASNPPYQAGFPFNFSAAPDNSLVNGSTVAFGDLNGDGSLDLVVGTRDGRVMAYRTNGQRLWVYPAAGNLGMGIESKPGIADIDGDGLLEVVVSVGSTLTPNQHGRLVVLSHTGLLQCEFLPNIVVTFREGMFASPAIADLDPSSPGLEIAVGSWDGWFRVLRPNCSVWWDKHVRDSIWSSAAIADLDRDGGLDIVVGVDSHAEGPPHNTADGGILHAWRADGTAALPGFPVQFDEVLYSSPAIGDIDGDGFDDVVIGTGRCWDNPACAPTTPHPGVGEYVIAVDRLGQDLAGWPVAIPSRYAIAAPALADLDGDDILEVIVNSAHKSTGSGRVHAWFGSGSSVPGFPADPTVPADCVTTTSPGTTGSPAVADLTGDGEPEIIVPMNTELVVLDNAGSQLSRQAGCTYPPGTLLLLSNFSLASSPTVIDLDGDGDLELVTAGGATFNGSAAGAIYAWDFAASASDTRFPWPAFRYDHKNLGVSAPALFTDGFEQGNTNRWSATVP